MATKTFRKLDKPRNDTDVRENNGSPSSIVTLGVIDMYTPPLKNRVVSTEYESFGDDNLLPQYMTDLYLNCPLHSGIITKKAEYTAGKSITVIAKDINKQTEVDNFVKSLSCGDLHSLVYKLALDWWLYGGFSVQVLSNMVTKLVSDILYQNFSEVRIGKIDEDPKQKQVFISVDWRSYNRDIEGYPIYGKGVDVSKPSFVYEKRYTPGFYYYPLPDYFSAVKDIETDIELTNWRKALVQNAFVPSGVLTLPNAVTDEDAMREMKQAIDKLSGTGGIGKVLTVFADGDRKTEYTPLSPNPLGNNSQKEYLDIIRENILMAHHIVHKAIVGLDTTASLGGDGNTLVIASNEFLDKQIIPIQNKIIGVLTNLFNNAGLDVTITIESNYINFNMNKDETKTK